MKNEKVSSYYPDEVVDKVRELFKKGHTYRKISEITGVPTSTFYRWVRDLKENPNRSTTKYSIEQAHEVKRLYDKGFKFKDIAKKMGIPRGSLSELKERAERELANKPEQMSMEEIKEEKKKLEKEINTVMVQVSKGDVDVIRRNNLITIEIHEGFEHNGYNRIIMTLEEAEIVREAMKLISIIPKEL